MDAPNASVVKAIHDQMARQRQVARELPGRYNQVDERFPQMLAQGAGNCDAFKPVEGLEYHLDRDRGIEKDFRTCAMSLMGTLSRQLLCDLPEDIGPTRMFSKLRPQ